MKNLSWRVAVFSLLLLAPIFLAYPQSEDDPFQWLENVEGEKQLAWVEKQNNVTLNYLTHFEGYNERYNFVYNLLISNDLLVYPQRHGNYIYNFWQDEKNPRGIVRRCPFDDYLNNKDQWQKILDIDSLSASDSIKWVYKGMQFANDLESRCIINLSQGGSDAVFLKEFDLNSRQFIIDGFNVGEAKSEVQWIDEDHIYIASDFGDGTLTSSGYPRMVKRWERNTELEDAEIVFEAPDTDMAVFPIVLHGIGSQYEFIMHYHNFYKKELYYITDTFLWRLPLPDDFYFDIFNDNFIIYPFTDWQLAGGIIERGTVVSIRLEDLLNKNLRYKVLFKGNERSSVEGIYATSNCVLLNTLDNIKSVVYKYTLTDGNWMQDKVDFLPSGSIEIVDADRQYPEYFVTFESFLQPTTLYIDKNDGTAPAVVMSLPSYFDASDCQVNQYEAKSKDGTLIPYFVIYKNDIRFDGENPTILYGYGGFQVSEKPYYSASLGKLWLEKGGVYAIANIRGGGEFGPDWHTSAILENKQKSYDDFIAVAEDLQNRNITSPQKLGITGGSNGGLLVGAVMTQRPDLFKAVVCVVPLLDMKRYSKLLAGRSWMAEYGDPDNPDDWEYIRKYSPYQNVVPGTKYPVILFLTSTRDDRVHPAHARKMTAKMQDMGNTVYLFENTEGGHAASYTPEQRAKFAAMNYTFFIDQLTH